MTTRTYKYMTLMLVCGAMGVFLLTGCATMSAVPRPERLVRAGVSFAGEAQIVESPTRELRLVALVRLQNLTDSNSAIESEQDNCEPPLILLDALTGHRFVWSHVSWRMAHEELAPPPISSVVCMGTGLIAELKPRSGGELGRQTYPVRNIRDDSIPAGRYAIGVPAIVLTVLRGFPRKEVLYLWSTPVSLP